MRELEPGTLAAVGDLGWEQLHHLGSGAVWLWQDLDGLGHGTLPDTEPDGVTAMWAASNGHWLLVRPIAVAPDEPGPFRYRTVRLVTGSTNEVGKADVSESVQFSRTATHGWRPADQQVPLERTGIDCTLIEVVGVMPLVFVDVPEPAI